VAVALGMVAPSAPIWGRLGPVPLLLGGAAIGFLVQMVSA
jgi:hypothetical protein